MGLAFHAHAELTSKQTYISSDEVSLTHDCILCQGLDVDSKALPVVAVLLTIGLVVGFNFFHFFEQPDTGWDGLFKESRAPPFFPAN